MCVYFIVDDKYDRIKKYFSTKNSESEILSNLVKNRLRYKIK